MTTPPLPEARKQAIIGIIGLGGQMASITPEIGFQITRGVLIALLALGVTVPELAEAVRDAPYIQIGIEDWEKLSHIAEGGDIPR